MGLAHCQNECFLSSHENEKYFDLFHLILSPSDAVNDWESGVAQQIMRFKGIFSRAARLDKVEIKESLMYKQAVHILKPFPCHKEIKKCCSTGRSRPISTHCVV